MILKEIIIKKRYSDKNDDPDGTIIKPEAITAIIAPE